MTAMDLFIYAALAVVGLFALWRVSFWWRVERWCRLVRRIDAAFARGDEAAIERLLAEADAMAGASDEARP